MCVGFFFFFRPVKFIRSDSRCLQHTWGSVTFGEEQIWVTAGHDPAVSQGGFRQDAEMIISDFPR